MQFVSDEMGYEMLCCKPIPTIFLKSAVFCLGCHEQNPRAAEVTLSHYFEVTQNWTELRPATDTKTGHTKKIVIFGGIVVEGHNSKRRDKQANAWTALPWRTRHYAPLKSW
jgi:hypothetical protein